MEELNIIEDFISVQTIRRITSVEKRKEKKKHLPPLV